MNKKLLISLVVSLLLVLSFVAAAQNNSSNFGKNRTDRVPPMPPSMTGLKNDKNMTYGQCVTQLVNVKNSCYDSVKESRKLCLANSNNSTACDDSYKSLMNDCKDSFKSSKVQCKNYRKTFMDQIMFWR